MITPPSLCWLQQVNTSAIETHRDASWLTHAHTLAPCHGEGRIPNPAKLPTQAGLPASEANLDRARGSDGEPGDAPSSFAPR